MLVVVRVYAGVDLGPPTVQVFALIHGVRVEYTRQFDIETNSPVHVEGPVHRVLVVRSGEHVRQDELAGPRGRARVVAEVGVLYQDARVLLVDADCVVDGGVGAGAGDEVRWEVGYRAFAVAAEFEGVGHVAAVFVCYSCVVGGA